mmetsp:Transcript_34983/g.59406  ORF Transcript_34983/g.59406 Transcript_34983/m.59406 type:complete len:258 (+) Transcript_34983:301-1074(+)
MRIPFPITIIAPTINAIPTKPMIQLVLRNKPIPKIRFPILLIVRAARITAIGIGIPIIVVRIVIRAETERCIILVRVVVPIVRFVVRIVLLFVIVLHGSIVIQPLHELIVLGPLRRGRSDSHILVIPSRRPRRFQNELSAFVPISESLLQFDQRAVGGIPAAVGIVVLLFRKHRGPFQIGDGIGVVGRGGVGGADAGSSEEGRFRSWGVGGGGGAIVLLLLAVAPSSLVRLRLLQAVHLVIVLVLSSSSVAILLIGL